MYAAVFGEELQQCIVFSQQRRYNGRKATGPGYFRWPQPGKGEQAMKISYKPLWKTLIDKNMSKKDLRLQAHLTTNHIANMGKGEHISMPTLIKICETLNCDISDVIALVPDDDP